MAQKDIATCAYCQKDFEVTRYGFKIPCPHCGKRLDIAPDPNAFLTTPFGIFGLAMNPESAGEMISLAAKSWLTSFFTKK